MTHYFIKSQMCPTSKIYPPLLSTDQFRHRIFSVPRPKCHSSPGTPKVRFGTGPVVLWWYSGKGRGLNMPDKTSRYLK